MKKSNKGDSLIAKLDKSRINDKIEAKEVRLISVDGEQLGIVPLEEALNRARESNLDLMEVAPNAKPPVCRILDYGKLKYEEKKKAQQSKKKQHVIKIKEVRLRPHIDDHDLDTKLSMGKKFLKDGCKLKVTLRFRGREMTRIDLGEAVMDRVEEILSDVAVVEKRNPLEGRQMHVIFTSK